MIKELKEKKCRPCEGEVEPLQGEELREMAKQLSEGWQIVEEHHIKKTYEFDDFRKALDFTNRVGEVAEEEGHHPDIFLTWGKVEIKIFTHNIDGLTENDFILAAKADQVR